MGRTSRWARTVAGCCVAALLAACAGDPRSDPPPPSTGGIRVDLGFSYAVWEPGTSSTSGGFDCPSAGLDEIRVDLPGGAARSFTCGEIFPFGMVIDGLPLGRPSITVTGVRAGVARYRSTLQVDVVGPPPATSTSRLSVAPLSADLDLRVELQDAEGHPLADQSCEGAGLATFRLDGVVSREIQNWSLVLTSGWAFPEGMPCDTFLPGPVRLDGLDLQVIDARIRAFRAGETDPAFETCSPEVEPSNRFDHVGPDVGGAGWTVKLRAGGCP